MAAGGDGDSTYQVGQGRRSGPVRVTSLGHAGLNIETSSGNVVVDPWFSPAGAFLASWFPYPDNAGVFDASLLEPTAIVVTHAHLDHLDPWFLAQVPARVPVIACGYPSDALRRKVLDSGPRDVIELNAWDRLKLCQDIEVFFVSEESPMNHDAALVVTSGDVTVLDLNDARLSPAQLRAIRLAVGGHVDLLLVQAAGASWYPMCYEYPAQRAKALSAQKRLARLSYVERVVAATRPGAVAPFAGPPCFLDPELTCFNAEMDGGIFPTQDEVAVWLAGRVSSRIVTLLPGDGVELPVLRLERGPAWQDFSFDDRDTYLHPYAARRATAIERAKQLHPHPSEPLWEPFEDYFRRLLLMSPYFNQQVGMRVAFNVTGPGGGRWSVDFRPSELAVLPEAGDASYWYSIESRWLASILSGSLSWEDFLLSMRFSAKRNPDVYNDHLLGLLKFADPLALEAVGRFESDMDAQEMITLYCEGEAYRVQRTCPHAGQDLLEIGEVLPGGRLRCLGHHYEFSLADGACLNGSCPPLRTERIPKRPNPFE